MVWMRLRREETGSAAAEYAVLGALVAVAALVGYVAYAGGLDSLYDLLGREVGGALAP